MKSVLYLWLLLLSCVPAFAQTGTLKGVVTDESGGVVAGARVTSTSSSGQVRETVSNKEGAYSFSNLPFGAYSVQAAAAQLSLITEPILAKGLRIETVLRVGNPSEEIVNVAKELAVDLVVIGSHGYGGLGRFLLGSTAERVVQYAHCPVLVVKGVPES